MSGTLYFMDFIGEHLSALRDGLLRVGAIADLEGLEALVLEELGSVAMDGSVEFCIFIK